jgi:hypothetical protein
MFLFVKYEYNSTEVEQFAIFTIRNSGSSLPPATFRFQDSEEHPSSIGDSSFRIDYADQD